jgi:hypothetical protein
MTHSCARNQVSRPRRDNFPRPTAVAPSRPSHEEIARLAYTCWEARGRQHGTDQEDWFRAERELLSRRSLAEPSYLL